MSKKSQITYFILLAFGILVSLLFLSYISNYNKPKEKLPLDINPIKQFIELCIKETGKQAVLFVSERGGHYNPKNYSYHAFFFDIPYYFDGRFSMNPSKAEVERQISEYMNDNIFFCFRNFADFKKIGYSVDAESLKLKTAIISDAVAFDLASPIKIKRNDASHTLDRLMVELRPVGLYKIISVDELIAQEQVKDKNSICISCILNWSVYYNLSISMSRLNESLILFSVIDNNTIIDGNPLAFNFVNIYEKGSCSNVLYEDLNFIQDCLKQQIKNLTPELKIDDIQDLFAKSGEPFFYDVNATGYNVTFRDFSNLFDINKANGIIKFTPQESQKGNHTVWIGAIDILRQKDFKNFKIIII